MSYIEILQEKREQTGIKFNEFINGKINNIEEKVKIMNSILADDNTEEKYLIEFLKLKVIQNNQQDLNESMELYEIGICKEHFNQNFKANFIKISSYEKIIDLFNKYKDIYKEKNKYNKLIKMIEMLEIKNTKFKQTFPISYEINKELYLNSLIYLLIKRIKCKCFKDDENPKENELIKLKNEYKQKKEAINNEIKYEKKIEKNEEENVDNKIEENLENKIHENKIEENPENKSEENKENNDEDEYDLEYEDDSEEENANEEERKKIKEIQEKRKNEISPELKIIINKITGNLAGNFFGYMHNLSKFIKNIYKYFINKFENNNIFTKEKFFEKEQKNDINLFIDLVYFIRNFDFADGPLSDFTKIWQMTLMPFSPEKIDFKLEKVHFKKNKDDLNLDIIVNKKTYKIKNIDNYVSDYHFFSFLENEVKDLRAPDCFKITNYLKMDKYSDIFIKLHWDKFRDYAIEILSSETIKSVFKKLFGDISLFPNEIDLKNILNNLRFFNYRTNFVAETKNRFLFIYFQASILEDLAFNINIKKMIYLAIFLISCFHEIIGHLYIRVHNYLNKRIQSPSPKDLKSPYSIARDKEAGEYVEELLFGNYEFRMTMKEILFILDKKNYNTNYSKFRENFGNANKCSLNISGQLKTILDLYEVKLSKINPKSGIKYQVNKSKYEEPYSFPQYHCISQINSYDE